MKTHKDITVRPVTGTLGAAVAGVDLSRPLDEQTLAEIRAAWLEHQALFFRDQELTPQQHEAFAGNFGELTKAGFMPTLEGASHVFVQEYPGLYSRDVTDITWHCDAAFLPVPSRGSVLYALDVPEGAGDTVWANMYAAYEDLSDSMQSFLSGLTAVHDNAYRNLETLMTRLGPEQFLQMRKMLPPSEHPVVRTHPETGRKCLFVSELMTSHIKGMKPAESRMLLDFLFRHSTQPEFQCRFTWRKNSVAFWDNRCTIHKGVFDFGDRHRLMHRVSIDDDRPPA